MLSRINKNSTLTHSQTLLPAIEQILLENGLSVKDIDEIALTAGPGSFTGLKIGVATAKGLAFPGKTPCVPVSTLEALAYSHADFDGIVAACLDARRNMLYCAFFEAKNGEITRLCEDMQISAEAAAQKAAEYKKPVLAAGDGAKLFASEFEKTEKPLSLPENAEIVDALGVFLAAQKSGKALPPEKIVPVYLRKPQAERDREEKLKNETSAK